MQHSPKTYARLAPFGASLQVSHLFTQKVSNLYALSTVVDDDVDWEMCIDCLELVSESLCDASDHVLNHALYCPEASDVLPRSVPDYQGDLALTALCFRRDETQIHVDVLDALLELAPWSLDDYHPALDGNGNPFRDEELLVLLHVPHSAIASVRICLSTVLFLLLLSLNLELILCRKE